MEQEGLWGGIQANGWWTIEILMFSMHMALVADSNAWKLHIWKRSKQKISTKNMKKYESTMEYVTTA